MNELFCPVTLEMNLVNPCINSSLMFWHEKYHPRILKENLKPHNLYVMPDVHKTEYQDLKKYFLKDLGLVLKSIILFPTMPNKFKDPHRDGPRSDYSYSAINIPVANTKGTFQVWWPDFDESRVKQYYLTKPDGEKSVGFDVVPEWSESEYDNIPNENSLELLSPYLLNTNVIHGVDNRSNDEWRLAMSLRFLGNPKLEQVKEKIITTRGYL